MLIYPIRSQSALKLDADGIFLSVSAMIICKDGCPVRVQIETAEREEDRPIFRIDDGHLVAENRPAIETIFMIVVEQIGNEIHAYVDGADTPSP